MLPGAISCTKVLSADTTERNKRTVAENNHRPALAVTRADLFIDTKRKIKIDIETKKLRQKSN